MTLMETVLLVDVSNSRTKFALTSATGELSEVRMLPTGSIAQPGWDALLNSWEYARACVSSVVPQATEKLRQTLACPVHVLSAASRLNLETEYATPHSLGADRLAVAMALAEQGGLPAIAVDAGTAVTFDLVVQKNGRPTHAGGAIAPGLRTMMQSLAGNTAQLPEIPLTSPPSPLGRDTVACLQSGVVLGFVEMVKGMLTRLSQETQTPPRIVITGGDAALLARYMPDVQVDKTLVFKGLQVAARLNRQFFSAFAKF